VIAEVVLRILRGNFRAGGGWLSTLTLVGGSSLAAITPTQAQSYQVAQLALCRNAAKEVSACAQILPPFNKLDRGVFNGSTIYFVATIIVEPQAISFLRANGYLPVNIVVWRDGTRVGGTIQAGISEDNWSLNRTALLEEVTANNGYFSWNTHFYVLASQARSVEVELTDAQGNVVYTDRNPVRIDINFAN
jgi:hypothetical protein